MSLFSKQYQHIMLSFFLTVPNNRLTLQKLQTMQLSLGPSHINFYYIHSSLFDFCYLGRQFKVFSICTAECIPKNVMYVIPI